MPKQVPALVAPSAGAKFERSTIERRDLRAHDVLIDIACVGICHSDIHQARGEWASAIFPLVPGHEIAGTVSAVGSEVARYAVGDRVGVGCSIDSCRECEHCRSGNDQYCLKGHVHTYGGRDYSGEVTYGGYSTEIVVDENYVLRLPDGMDFHTAAPMMCAGATTWSPLRHWRVGQGSRVAVIGLGGLGHVGVQIAAALGAEVTVLSQSVAKRDDGLALGATDYRATSDPATFTELAGTFDLILNTVSADLDITAFLTLLRLDGTLVFLGVPDHPQQSFIVLPLLGGRRSLAGSAIASIPETQEMLDFCGEHGIGARVEVISADEVDAAYDRVVASQVRYRYVIDVSTIPAP